MPVLLGDVLDPRRPGNTGVVEEHVEYAERRSMRSNTPSQLRDVGDVAGLGDGSSAGLFDLVDDRLGRLARQVDDDHRRALLGEQHCARPAHPRARSGDDRDAVGKHSTHLATPCPKVVAPASALTCKL